MTSFKQKLFSGVLQVPPVLEHSRYGVLDCLRAIAGISVVFVHIGINHSLRKFNMSLSSDTGVHLFFVISGFLITTLLLKERAITGNISLKRFYIRRALRILPVAWLFILVLFILNYWLNLKIRAIDFLTSLLMLKNLPVKNEPYTAHFWSLAVEEQFYLIFPFLLSYNVNAFIRTAIMLTVIVPLVSILGHYHIGLLYANNAAIVTTKIIMYSFWKGPCFILVGSLTAVFLFKEIIKPPNSKLNYFSAMLLIVAAFIISSRSFLWYTQYISELVSAIFMAIAIIIGLNANNLLLKLFDNRFFRQIAVISYSLYIWQELFIGTYAWQPWMKIFRSCPVEALIFIKLIFITIIGLLSYYWVEKPFLRMKEKYKRVK